MLSGLQVKDMTDKQDIAYLSISNPNIFSFRKWEKKERRKCDNLSSLLNLYFFDKNDKNHESSIHKKCKKIPGKKIQSKISIITSHELLSPPVFSSSYDTQTQTHMIELELLWLQRKNKVYSFLVNRQSSGLPVLVKY